MCGRFIGALFHVRTLIGASLMSNVNIRKRGGTREREYSLARVDGIHY
jgi:hypothetical protein